MREIYMYMYMYMCIVCTLHVHIYVLTSLMIVLPTCSEQPQGISPTYMRTYMFLMRDEKEERKKQARSNKQSKATQHTQGSHSS